MDTAFVLTYLGIMFVMVLGVNLYIIRDIRSGNSRKLLLPKDKSDGAN